MMRKALWPKWSATQEMILFLLLLLSYIYVFPRWADPNQNSRLNMVIAVVDDGTFQIDKYVHNTVDYAKVGEHYYSDKAPGAAFLGIPIYAGLRLFLDLPVMDGLMNRLANNDAFKATLRAEGSGILQEKVRFAIAQVAISFVVAIFPTALLGVLLFRWLARLTLQAWPRWIIVLGYGLLTPAFAYAGAFYGHQLSAALLFGVFYLAFQIGESTNQRMNQTILYTPTGSLIVIGLLLGYSVVTEYPTLLMVGILYLYTCYVLIKSSLPNFTLSTIYQLPSTVYKQIAWVTVPAMLVAAGWMIYNTTVFGGPLELGYSHSELWLEQHHTGFMSLNIPHATAMWGITFGLFRGLFVLSPWLLLALPGFWLWARSGQYRAEWLVALSNVILIFLFNSSSIMWWGGFAIGPRYMLPALPFMVLPIIFVLSNQSFVKNRILLAAVWLLLAWSFIATWGLTLAEQAFPSDAIFNPLVDYALPNWLAGNIARNLGTILGLQGIWSLLPLLLSQALIALSLWLLNWRNSPSTNIKFQPSPVSTRREA
jgi:hypothetical protein